MSRFWDRVEPNSTDETLIEGLQARVADPLWMLARQWQMGEFDGEDAASPVRTSITTQTLQLSTLTTTVGMRQSIVGSPLPLEALIEAIPPNAHSAEDQASLACAALAGLEVPSLDPVRFKRLLRKIYPFLAERNTPDHPLTSGARRRLRMLERNSFDVFELARDKGRKLMSATGAPSGLADWIKDAMAMTNARGRAIAASTDCWSEQTLEYNATLSAKAEKSRVDLTLSDYGGGRLDWYSFDHAQVPADNVHTSSLKTQRSETTPMALSYAGQPLQRFWEFEDAEIHFGNISAGPADIARLIVADFAAIGGDDVFVIPVVTQVGSLLRVSELKLRDTFGRNHIIQPSSTLDSQKTGTALHPFSLFELADSSGVSPATGSQSNWLPILPVTANIMNGSAIERVSLRRDEEANLAWAVEEEIEGPFGRPLRRRQAWEIVEAEEIEEGAAWPYRLQTPVPPWWVPLVPERSGNGSQTVLRRARLSAWKTMPPETTGPKSRAMDSSRPIVLAEHAVPACGVRLSRHWQLARAYDGQVVLWQSWKREYGARERASGLQYDAIARRW